MIDARKFVPYERGILGFFSMAAHTQKILRNLTQSGVLERYLSEKQSLVGLEPQILGWKTCESAQRNTPWCAGCGTPTAERARPFTASSGDWKTKPAASGAGVPAGSRASGRTPEKSSAGRILASGLFLVVLVALCALSHPAVGQLPDTLYFPCLGLAMVALWIFLYFIIKQRRGE